MSLKRSIGLAVFVAVALLVSRVPASVIGSILPQTLTASGFTGTVWRGEAAHVQAEVQGQPFALGRVAWTVHPLGLLTGDVVTIRSRWGSQRIVLAAGIGLGGSFYLNDIAVNVGLDWVRKLLPLYIGGQLRTDIAELVIDADGKPTAAQGQVVWEDATWRAVGGDVSLGTYAVAISSSDDGIEADVVTIKGALVIDGSVSLTEGRYRLVADLSGPAARNEAFQQAIALMAVPNRSGYRIELSGTL